MSSVLKSIRSVFAVGQRPLAQRNLSALLLGMGMTAVAFAASAHEPHTTANIDPTFRTPQQAILISPFLEMGATHSNPGESKDNFLRRVGGVLHAFTSDTGYEACGVVMQRAGEGSQAQWMVRLISNRSQISCMRIMFDEPGYTYTGHTIHSHPIPDNENRPFVIRANAQDRRLVGWTCGRRLKIEDDRFSDNDLNNGGGYLVSRGVLWYHSGEGDPSQAIEVGPVTQDNTRFALRVGGWRQHNLPVAQLSETSALHSAQAWGDPSQPLPKVSCAVDRKR